MSVHSVIEILGFAITVGGIVAALSTDRGGPKWHQVHRVAIVVALITLLLMGGWAVKEWHDRREAIRQAQLDILAEMEKLSLTEEDILQKVNARRPPGHAMPADLLFTALYSLVETRALHVNTESWQDVHANSHVTHLYYR
jgi:hypothetical protein